MLAARLTGTQPTVVPCYEDVPFEIKVLGRAIVDREPLTYRKLAALIEGYRIPAGKNEMDRVDDVVVAREFLDAIDALAPKLDGRGNAQ
jgi:hypothetical protein